MEDSLNYTKLWRFPPFRTVEIGRARGGLLLPLLFLHRYPEDLPGRSVEIPLSSLQ